MCPGDGGVWVRVKCSYFATARIDVGMTVSVCVLQRDRV